METIHIKDFIDSKHQQFSIHYYKIIHEKIAAFIRVDKDQLILDNGVAPDQFVYGDRVIVILVSGKDLKATLKIHYSPSEVISIIPPKLIESSSNPDFAVESYFCEMANLIAGRLKASFMDMKYTVGISLPIGASCYDELVSSDKLVNNRVYAFTAFKMRENTRFVVTLTIDDEGSGLNSFQYDEGYQEDVSDDFL